MSLRSPLSRARGLGSAKDGVHHWWIQRATAVALVPLTLWFAFGLAANVGGGYEAVRAWVACPFTAVALILFIATAFHHGQLGLQVVIEDYVHSKPMNLSLLFIVKFGSFAFAVAGILAVLKIALTPGLGA